MSSAGFVPSVILVIQVRLDLHRPKAQDTKLLTLLMDCLFYCREVLLILMVFFVKGDPQIAIFFYNMSAISALKIK